jgi:DNA-binding IclR family transcriptional regulator
VIALMGTAGSFDSDTQGGAAQTLLAATQRLSRRFGYVPG